MAIDQHVGDSHDGPPTNTDGIFPLQVDTGKVVCIHFVHSLPEIVQFILHRQLLHHSPFRME
jgi:hypothetical protein